jgi:hypothetical protein
MVAGAVVHQFIVATYFIFLDSTPNMFRYIVLQTFGGVYSDIDTVCLKPISSWIPASNSSFTNTTTKLQLQRLVS